MGEFTNKPDEQGHGSVLNFGDRDSDGKFTAITANSQGLHTEVILTNSGIVFRKRPNEVLAQSRCYDRIAHWDADDILASVAEHLFRSFIKLNNGPVEIRNDHGVI